MHSTSSFFTSFDGEKRWREHMIHKYIQNIRIRPCVFLVPDHVKETKPDAYVPQVVGLGPYHHFRPDLHLMDSQKRDAIVKYLNLAGDFEKFAKIVNDSSLVLGNKTRSCYDRYLGLGEETLSWIVVVDSIFLLQFIHAGFGEAGSLIPTRTPFFSKVVGDVFMLENQIPFLMMVQVNVFLKSKSFPVAAEVLDNSVHRLCKEYSPLELLDACAVVVDMENHILNYLYVMIMENYTTTENDLDSQSTRGDNGGDQKSPWKKMVSLISGKVMAFADYGSQVLEHAIEEFNSALATAKNAGVKIPGNVEKVSRILQNFEKALQLNRSKEAFSGDKIEIPSVYRIVSILNIKFKPLPHDRGIGNIDLELDVERNYNLRLPVIHMRANTEIILRNLVAYEATIPEEMQGRTKFREYVDLMCGIIKSERDVKLLNDAGIMIMGDGLTAEEIVKMCNGIKKSDEEPNEKSRVLHTGNAVNNLFRQAQIVKLSTGISKLLAGLVKCLKPLFPLLVLLFLAFQSACEIFDCRRRPYGGAAMQNLYSGDYYLELDPRAKIRSAM